MNISNNKVVELSYELRVNGTDGEIIESVMKDSPLAYIHGIGGMLPKFESNINGLKKGDAFNFKLEYNDAYGAFSEEGIIDLPLNIFEVDGKTDEKLLTIGNIVPMKDKNGNLHQGRVLEKGTDVVKMDFNHPLANKDLYFSGEVVSIREATEEELIHNHVGHECTKCGKH
jgi:FKBP-type peptidyl-prolyl cis-trans isomerase SlyD